MMNYATCLSARRLARSCIRFPSRHMDTGQFRATAGSVGGQATEREDQEAALKLPPFTNQTRRQPGRTCRNAPSDRNQASERLPGDVATRLRVVLKLAEVVSVVTLRGVATFLRSTTVAADVCSVAGAR